MVNFDFKAQWKVATSAHFFRLPELDADRIAFMENGTISYVEPFEKLVEVSQNFNELVKIGFLEQS